MEHDYLNMPRPQPPEPRLQFEVDHFPMLTALKNRYEGVASNIGLPNVPLPSVQSVPTES